MSLNLKGIEDHSGPDQVASFFTLHYRYFLSCEVPTENLSSLPHEGR